jgi:hypothetical protein
MSTVVQNEDGDYDIDVAVVFDKSILGNKGGTTVFFNRKKLRTDSVVSGIDGVRHRKFFIKRISIKASF